RSTWYAVPARPTASNRSSVSGVATRVRARTLAYDSSPRARAPASSGSVSSARATRTRSRAAPGSSPTRQESHSAQERKPLPQPPRESNWRMRSRRRAVAASTGRQLGDLVAELVQVSRAHGESPFRVGDSTPEFSCGLEGATSNDRGGDDFFPRGPSTAASAVDCERLGRHSRGARTGGDCARRILSSGNRWRHAGGPDDHLVELTVHLGLEVGVDLVDLGQL